MHAQSPSRDTTAFIIEDDPIMAECVARALASLPPYPSSSTTSMNLQIFSDALAAMSALQDVLPRLILLDILLSGPDGFTLLHELASYPDTARIPIIIISSLHLDLSDMQQYGVVAVLDKSTMTPADIQSAAQSALMPTTSPTPQHPHPSQSRIPELTHAL